MFCRKPADVTDRIHLYVCDDDDFSTNEMKTINAKLMSDGNDSLSSMKKNVCILRYTIAYIN